MDDVMGMEWELVGGLEGVWEVGGEDEGVGGVGGEGGEGLLE